MLIPSTWITSLMWTKVVKVCAMVPAIAFGQSNNTWNVYYKLSRCQLWNNLSAQMKNIEDMNRYEFKWMLFLWGGRPHQFSIYQYLRVVKQILKFLHRQKWNMVLFLLYNLHVYDVFILWCFMCYMLPFGLYRVELLFNAFWMHGLFSANSDDTIIWSMPI